MAPTINERIFRKLEKILGNLEEIPEYQKFRSAGFMDLGVDRLRRDEVSVTIALSHYFKQNGDMIPDPDMEVRIYPGIKMAEALTLQDSFNYRQVYPEPGKVDVKAKKDLNAFLNYWLHNILNQGYEKAQGDCHEL